MTYPPITALARTIAARYDLPVQLVLAIVKVESNGDPWAVRYESAFYKRYIVPLPIVPIPPCSLDTERVMRATSWGLMQIMGQVARELRFAGAFLSELCEPAVGLEYGCRHLAKLRDRYHAAWGLEGVTAAYNAGSPRREGDHWGNQPYVDKVRAAGGLL